MISAVLFDLDGTLLEITLGRFLRDYFTLLGPVVAELLETEDVRPGLDAVMAATQAMGESHSDSTNREVFNRVFARQTGLDLGEPHASAALERFYADRFPTLRGEHGPRPGAARAVATARQLGLRTALATNPIFPLEAIHERLRWTGIDETSFDTVTSYETSHACKPWGAYFTEVADRLNIEPGRCLMVGDDRGLDLPAAAVGMRTFYVGNGAPIDAHWTGSLDDLADLLPRLAD